MRDKIMKRDWDIIRDILLKLEAKDEVVTLNDFSEEKAREYSYHVELLIEAKLLRGEMDSAIGLNISDFSIESLTWEGHDFLDAIKSDTVWVKIKSVLAKQGLGMTFEIVKKVGTKLTLEFTKNIL